jgi:hypothetical protein
LVREDDVGAGRALAALILLSSIEDASRSVGPVVRRLQFAIAAIADEDELLAIGLVPDGTAVSGRRRD